MPINAETLIDQFKVPYLGIDHLGLAVHDIEMATHTYCQVLGFELSGEDSLEERGLHVRFIETGNSRIELLGALHEQSEVSAFLKKRGEGLHHVCFAVADVEQCFTMLKKSGAHLISTEVESGAHGMKVVFLHPKGAHGLLLELAQIPNTKAS